VSKPEDVVAPHETSLAVWDLATPVVAGRRATLKVGAACSGGCDLTGTAIALHTETGRQVGSGTLGPAPWPGTSALYWTELDVAAPDTAGTCSWTLQTTAAEPPHEHVASPFRFIAVNPPEHRVTLKVVEKHTGAPVDAVELRLGIFRAATNEAGVAQVEVPGGAYDVTAWKIGYEILSSTADVAGDIRIQLEVAAAADPEQPYWM
jgi:hypothetical protein